jgi:hypothetical protein
MVSLAIVFILAFSRRGALDEAANRNQLARMVALLGPPPPQLLADSGPRALIFFDEDESIKGEILNEGHPNRSSRRVWNELDRP